MVTGDMLSCPAPTYFVDTGSDAATYSTSIEPHGVYDSNTNKTWFTWEGFNGTYRIAQATVYDHALLSWSNIYTIGATELLDDPHGNPCLLRDADGYWHSFFGDHVTPTQHWVSTNPDDPSAWTFQSLLPIPSLVGIGEGATYIHAVLIGATIWLIYRAGPLSQNCYLKSTSVTSGVVVWDTQTALFDLADGGGDGRAEPGGLAVSGTDIHFVCCRAPSNDTYRRGVYKVVLHTTNGSISNLDNSVTIAAGSLPANKATMDASFLIADSGAGNLAQYWIPDFCFDSSGGQHFLYTTSSDDVSFDLKYFNYISGVQSSPVTVVTVPIFSLGTLVPLESAAVAITWNVYDVPGAGGGVYRAVRLSGGPIGSASLIQAAISGLLPGPPERVRNSQSHQFMWFQSLDLSSSSIYTKGFCYGDNGYLQRSSFAAWPPGSAANATALFNPSDRSTSNLHISANNLVITTFAVNLSIRSVTSHSSGKFHVEFTIILNRGTSGAAIGVASGSFPLTKFLGEDANSFGFFGTLSQTYTNNVATNRSGLAFATFQVVAMEVDFTAQKLWFKNATTGGDWNGSPTANPATGVGGIDISGLTNSPFFICVNLYDLYNTVALNTGNLPWAVTPSSGFGSW